MALLSELALPGVRGLSPYQPGKAIEQLARELGITDIIKLASNENPRGPSKQVLAAINAALPELSRYPDGSGFLLKKALSAHLGVAEETITIGNGSNDVLELVARAFLTTSSEVIISDHAFVVYPLVTRAIGARLISVPALDWGHDLNAMLAAVTDATRIIFIANPNNPTGTWIKRAELDRFLERLPETVIVVLDEAYFEYVEEDTYPDGLELIDEHPNLMVTRTFSKVYGLAALRLGYSVSHADVADLMNRIRQPFNVNSLSLAAGEAALTDQEYVRESVALNATGLKFLIDGVTQLGLTFIPSVGNFLSVDMGKVAMPVYDALLREGVIVRPIGVYGLPNHLRVTVGLPGENERFLSALEKVLR